MTEGQSPFPALKNYEDPLPSHSLHLRGTAFLNRSGEIYARYTTENSSQEEHQESRSRRQEKAHCRSSAPGRLALHWEGAKAARRQRNETLALSVSLGDRSQDAL